MKLAMAIGDKRHYVVHAVLGRHFVQTSKSCGLSDKIVAGVLQDLNDTAAKSIGQVLSALPKGFPEEMANSIAESALQRLKLLATARIDLP